MPPAPWVWWSIILSIFAVVVTIIGVISVFQMFFGKPKIKAHGNSTKGYELIYLIKSVPPNGFLRWIGVDRRIIDIDFATTVMRLSDNEIIEFFVHPTLSSKFVLVHIAGAKSKYDGRVFIKNQGGKYGNGLDVGSYIFELDATDTKDRYQALHFKREFRVSSVHPFVEWTGKERHVKTKDD